MASPIMYKQVPEEDVLRADFSKFIQDNPQFSGLIKIGKTSQHNLQTRYSSTDKYKQLEDTNVFCFCSSEDIALEVEITAQQLSKDMETFIWKSDSGKGSSGGDSKDYLVYVTTLK